MTASLRVLFAVDGSACSTAMIRCWSGWRGAADTGLQARLLTVVPPPLHVWPTSGFDPGLIDEALRSIGRERLADAERLMKEGRVPWESAVRIGAPAETIVAEARREGADLIVLGTRGLSVLRGLLVGSVALRVAQSSPLPVWLMPPNARCPLELGRRMKLLVAVDGSDAANQAAAWAARVAPAFGHCSIELVSVRPELGPVGAALGVPGETSRNWDEQLGSAAVDAARAAMGDAGSRASARIGEGDVVPALCRVAAETDADAIVVGPRNLGALGKVTLGSVSSALLQTATCSVIVVREAVE
jgi:nucleotide-binding universal stress UspA family protein